MSTNTSNTARTDALRILVYSAICLAIAVVLSNIVMFRMPQGGSVTLASMLFIALVGYWFGVRAGIVVGIAFGLLQIAFGGYVMTPIQGALDYLVSYGALGGIAGIFNGRQFGKYGLYIGYLLGVVGTFFSQYLSGVIFFAQFAPEGTHIIIWSAIYNLSHNLPEVVITFAILGLPNFKHALDRVAPAGAVSSDNALSRALQDTDVAERLPYAIVSISLAISFFIFPLIHRGVRIRSDASGWGIASGGSNLFNEAAIGSFPAAFLLLLAPLVMFVLTLMGKSVRTLLYSAVVGLVVKLGFVIWAIIATGANGVFGVEYSITMSSVIVLLVYAGLAFALWGQERKTIA